MQKAENTLQMALSNFYSTFEIGPEGGINDPFVRLQLFSGLSLYIPNLAARKKVLRRHDMHHALTGYPANMKGEFEISAWEVSTGCIHNWLALILNYSGMLAGTFLYPMAVWKAYLRGKGTQNLYNYPLSDQQLMSMKVNDLRSVLRLNLIYKTSPFQKFKTALNFLCMLLFGAMLSLAGIVFLPYLLGYSVYVHINANPND